MTVATSNSSPASSRWATLGILLPVVMAYALAAWCLVGVAWDGSNYLFLTLQAGEPVITHHRYSNLPTLQAVAQASRFVSDARFIAGLYTTLVAMTPVASLALCLWFLRGSFVALRIWAVLGVLLGILPGQLCIMSEASLAVQAFWPLLALIAIGLPLPTAPCVLLLSVYIFFLHPTSLLLFGLAALLCFAAAFLFKARRRALCMGGSFFLVVAVLRFFFSVATTTSYEKSELAFGPNWMAFLGAFGGPASGMLLCLYGLSSVYLAGTLKRLSPTRARAVVLALLAAFLAVGLFWALDSRMHNGGLSYRRFVLVCSLPFVAGAALHWSWLQRRGPYAPQLLPSAPVLLSVVFAIVFAVQSLTWRSDWRRLESALASAPGPFITKTDVPWIIGRPLDHWSSTTLSIILRGRVPDALYVEKIDGLAADGITLYPGGIVPAKDGWFQLSRYRDDFR